MTRFMLAAFAAAAIAAPASASTANVFVQGQSVHVPYGDLDLRSTDGRTQLSGRIQKGARMLCSEAYGDDFTSYGAREGCYRAVLADGAQQMNKIVRR
jgi:UrcA family protein